MLRVTGHLPDKLTDHPLGKGKMRSEKTFPPQARPNAATSCFYLQLRLENDGV